MKIENLQYSVLKEPPRIKGLDFSFVEIENARQNDRILMISPFVSAKCNLRCIYCYADSGRALQNELSFEEYTNIILEGRNLGAKTVWIPGHGEPLLQNRFMEIVEFVNSLDMMLVFFTNGTLITEEIAKFLFERNATIITKCNSFSQQTQDILSGRKGSFQQIQRGLRILIDAGFNTTNPTRLGIESIICKLNYQELPQIFRWARRNNVYPYLEMMVHQGRAANPHNTTKLNLPIYKEKMLFEKLLEIDEEEFGYTWVPVPPYVANACDKIFYNVTIDSLGWIKPCCAVDLKISNIREKPLNEVIKSEVFKRVRNVEKYITGNCRNCKIKGCHYGCRSEAYTCGDYFGSYPRCWHNPIAYASSREVL